MNKYNKTYLVVFYGKFEKNKIYDIGDDPCFDKPPTWGICRPNYRRSCKVGDTLFFLAKIGNVYYLKGWFEVGYKIDYVDALFKFPDRKNVIISRQQRQHNNIVWKNKALKKCYKNRHNNCFPKFFSELDTQQGKFYQNQVDTHEIDNWKCSRILNCKSWELAQCVKNNNCAKSGLDITDNKYKNYIVAKDNKWDDVDYLKITLDDIKKNTCFVKKIITPCNQHNVLRFDEYRYRLLKFIDQRKKEYKKS